MNSIFLLKGTSGLRNQMNKTHLVLLSLLSETSTDEDAIYSYLDEEILLDKLYLTKEELRESFEELKTLGYITYMKDGYIQLGVVSSDKTKRLYCDEVKEVSLDEEKTKVKEFYSSYREICKRTGKSGNAKQCKDNIEEFFGKPTLSLGIKDFIVFYTTLYEIIFQESCRSFTGKEVGQLKSLLKWYDGATLIKIICFYLMNSDQFSKNIPTIGLLLFHKDTIYSKVHKVSIKKKVRESLRVGGGKSEF